MSNGDTVTRGRSWFRVLVGIAFGFGLGVAVTNFVLVRPCQRNNERVIADFGSLSSSFDTLSGAYDKQVEYTNQVIVYAHNFCESLNAALYLLDPKHKPDACDFGPVEAAKASAWKPK